MSRSLPLVASLPSCLLLAFLSQCSASTYESLSGFDSAAVCNPAAGSKSPAVSTILYKLNYAGGVAGSGAKEVATGAAAIIAGAAAAGAALLLG